MQKLDESTRVRISTVEHLNDEKKEIVGTRTVNLAEFLNELVDEIEISAEKISALQTALRNSEPFEIFDDEGTESFSDFSFIVERIETEKPKDETEIVLQNFLREIEAAYINSPRLRETFRAVNLSVLDPRDVAGDILETLIKCESRKFYKLGKIEK